MSGISRNFLLASVIPLGLLLLMACTAQAFFPKTKDVADKLKTKYKGLESWQVELGFNSTSGHRVRCWRKGELWRQEWVASTANSTSLIRVAVGNGKEIAAVRPSTLSIPYSPLHLAWLKAPKKAWQGMGMEDEVKSYQFLKERPCLVLGAEYGDLWSTQVWIDLERHVPLRLIAPSGITWRWSKYYSLGNHLLPTHLRIAFPQGKSFAFDLTWQQVATEIPRSRFDPRALSRESDSTMDPGLQAPRMRFLLDNLPPANATTVEQRPYRSFR